MDATQIDDYGSAGAPATPPVDASAIVTPVPATQPRPHLYAINAFTALLVIGTGALFLGGALGSAAPIRVLIPQPAMFAVLCVLWAAASLAPVVLHYRGNSYDFVLDAAPMLMGLVFLSPVLFIASVVCEEAIYLSVMHRQAPVKVAFNVASVGLSATVAVLIYRGILGTSSPVGLRGWPAAAAALCAFVVILSVNLGVVIKLAGQTPERRTGSYFAIQAMLTAASVCLAFVVLDTAWFNVWAILPLLFVGGLIIVVYRAYYRLWLKFASLNRLHESTRTLGMATLEPSSMSLEVLEQVCTVMRARRAQLVFAEPQGIPRRISLDNHVPSGVEPISLNSTSLVTSVITSGKPDRQSRDAQHGSVFTDPIVGEYRDAVIAPLMNGQVTIGAIVALDRDEEADSFEEEDLQLFGALVAAASANLERANHVEKLRFEADAKEFRATHDVLTGLPNRALFVSTIGDALSENEGAAVVLWDIDRFQDVNDTLGHAIGDRLLREVSERLLRAVSGRATVACFGADEFALVLPGVTEADEAIALVNDLNRELSRPIKLDDLSLRVKASAGISLAPEHSNDATLLLQKADIAMRLAKERHSNIELYSFEHDRSRPRRLKLGGLLTHALEQRTELSVMYQPVGDIRSGDIVQVEALARWHHPEYGSIPPEEFVTIAEDMGMISEITDFVLAESCAQLARWRTAGIHIGVAVNTSVREYSDDRLVERVARHLAANDIPSELLTLEVTETVVVDDFTQASRVLEALAALGVRIAIDDFGTGYSNLQYLHRLPLHKLKLDRSFVTNLPSDLNNAIIVRSSIAMAHSLGLTVVAEGAEDEVTCAMLADAECDFIQGYYLAKPMEPSELESWLLQGATLQFRTFGGSTATPGLAIATAGAKAQASGARGRHLGPRPLQPTAH